MLRGLGRALRLPPREQLATLRALQTLLVVEALIRHVRLPRLAALLRVPLEVAGLADSSLGRAHFEVSQRRPHGSRRKVDPAHVERARRATRRLLRQWPFGSGPCLRESLVLGHLLRRHGPVLRLGVAREEERVLAHAWLELGGEALDDSERFVTFPAPSPRSDVT